MAIAEACCICATCGSTFEIRRKCMNRRDADEFEEWAKDNYDECPECRIARIKNENEVKHQEINAESAEKSRIIGLPDLKGTEKQVAWANTIRLEWIDYYEKYIKALSRMIYDYKNDHEKAEEVAEWESIVERCKIALEWAPINFTFASFWIENRNATYDIVLMAVDMMKRQNASSENSEEAEEIASEKAKEAQEKAERAAKATVSPEGVESPVIATISADAKTVSVIAEKNSTLINTVKKCGMSWEGNHWQLEIRKNIHETPDGLMAYIGNRLLNAGIAIRIYDDDVLAAAVNGTAAPRATRVLISKGDGLRLWWEGRDDEIYVAAKRIKGAKYDNHGFSLPVSSWREVMDMADLNGVAISDGAIQAIAEYKAQITNKKAPAKVSAQETQKQKLNAILQNDNGVIADLIDQ